MNLDKPFKLYPMVPKKPGQELCDIYTTDDEQWLVMRRSVGWAVAARNGDDRGPRLVPSLSSAIDEIKERITGRPVHRHQPERVLFGHH